VHLLCNKLSKLSALVHLLCKSQYIEITFENVYQALELGMAQSAGHTADEQPIAHLPAQSSHLRREEMHNTTGGPRARSRQNGSQGS